MRLEQPNSKVRNRQNIAWAIEDALAFESLLRTKYPDIRFLRYEYKHKWDETWRWRPVILERHKYRASQEQQIWMPACLMRDPTGEEILYRESLAYPWESNFIGWLEPENWKPEWWCLEPGKDYELINIPRCRFKFWRSEFNWYTKDGSKNLDTNWSANHEFWRPASQAAEHEVHCLMEGTLECWWADGDEEAAAFAKTVFRIADKVMSNRFRLVDQETLMPRSVEPVRLRNWWAGYHAMKWAAERRHNYLFDCMKPPDYDFGPDEPDC